jgi:hypothetical protein
MLTQESAISLPLQRPPAPATTQPFASYTAHTPIELPETTVVRRATVMLILVAPGCFDSYKFDYSDESVRALQAQLTDPHLKGCPGRVDVQTSLGSELGSPS